MAQGGYFPEWLNRFRHHLRMRNYSPRTISSYEQVIRHFGSYVWLVRNGDPGMNPGPMTDLTASRMDTGVEVHPLMITDFLEYMTRNRVYRPTTLHRVISTLSSFYRYLQSQDAVAANPVVRVDRPRVKGQELRYLKHSQVLALLLSIPSERDRLIIRTIYATGLRVSELCALKIEDIDFDEQTIRVLGKSGKIRTVFVDTETLSEIESFVQGRVQGPVFPGSKGKAISPRTVQLIFREHAPEGITPHKIRHSYASELYRRSRNLRVVQENLGHTSIRTTEIYLHTDLEERKRVYQEFFPLTGEKEGDKPHDAI
jgi:site-specific recombinase XerD